MLMPTQIVTNFDFSVYLVKQFDENQSVLCNDTRVIGQNKDWEIP